jgi:hypothetical protein
MTLQDSIVENADEFEASLLVDGHPDVLNVFLRLTGEGEFHLRTDPRGENLKWDGRKIPEQVDLAADAALRLLMDLDYVADVVRLGNSDYLVRASDRAKVVRSVYDRFPNRSRSVSRESLPAAP